MAEVARLAGVSTATVSHVLNGTRPVREDTRRQVLAAMEQVQYTPNAAARSLATARTRTLGLALSAISNPYLGELLHAVEDESAAAGYTLLLTDPHDDPGYEATAVARLRSRVDGVLLAPSADSAGTLSALATQKVPTVLVDRMLGGGYDEVGTENVEPVARLVEHLVSAGNTRIGFVAGHAGLATTVERLDGYRLGLQRAGLDYSLVVEGHSEAEPARRAVGELLARPDRPAALVTGNNAMTIGAVQAAHDVGLRIPGDVALAAFDDFPWADAFSPRLTVVAQSFAEIGREAVRLLLRRMTEPDADPRSVRLPTRFVHRDSCGCGWDGRA
ncbi:MULTISPECIES: LacI family DNA-binding transcriptional regulator [Pseudonocardia]|uniref:Ribose operon repressor n=2 Tax=Pseudonocardia TaxID=1847 RepID=A0A1Y2N2V8_PSEAH|nr:MULTISPECIES: LacI family DNA-binding transcriptional regulator [Pseudonocardia]OSY41238.1 Ribose operon repressor [Pseudonocardia autotrophica]TDN76693.1 LacI family transcriptional regulator [Pseudonocardia autotrophica]BBG00695.1 LacI family transcriptional regulator [Pseudonocardia autotrophica]GEC24339.1 LacI family transcriptional regulator [Pseudonocardia saturnea]